jgi:hypothetical protein
MGQPPVVVGVVIDVGGGELPSDDINVVFGSLDFDDTDPMRTKILMTVTKN